MVVYRDRAGRWCGFVDVEGARGGRFLRRYFLLEPESNRIACYADHPSNLSDGTKAIETINLNRISTVTSASTLRPKVPYCFVINEVSRRWIVQADNEADLQNWIRVLNEACKVTVPKDLKVSSEVPEGPHRTAVIAGVVMHLPVGQDADGDPPPPLPTTTTTTPRVPHVIHAGYCVKQGGVMRNWKRRYFVLDESSLCYYRSELECDPLRTIHLRDVHTVRAACTQLAEHMMRDNLYEVVTQYRTFYIQANSPQDMTQWVQHIYSTAKVWCRGDGVGRFTRRGSCPLTASPTTPTAHPAPASSSTSLGHKPTQRSHSPVLP